MTNGLTVKGDLGKDTTSENHGKAHGKDSHLQTIEGALKRN
jgi:hypothetical protein